MSGDLGRPAGAARFEKASALMRAMIGIPLASIIAALFAHPAATDGGMSPAAGGHPPARCQAAANTAASASAQPAEAAAPASTAPAATGAHKPGQAKHGVKVSPYRPDRFAGRAGSYYRLVWGVDLLAVKWGESGEVIRFTYRVLDADKAKVLNDKKNEPSLIDPQAGVKLVVPSLENVGQLRQSTTPENGKSYWMVFSNKGRPVKRGDHVAVVIGAFHADGLVVD
jgi:hypothetical protein